MSNNSTQVVSVPYQKYSTKEINHQPGLSAADRQLLALMHAFDRGDDRACFARDLRLADELGITEGAVRNRVSRLRKKGYIVTLGYERHGIANRRVVLKYGVKTDRPGSYKDIKVNGRPCRIKRKTGQENPIIFLREEERPPLPPERGLPSHDGERQIVMDRDSITNTPISASSPVGAEAEFSQSFFSFSQAPVASADCNPTASPAETDAPSVTTPASTPPTHPATMADLDTNPGRRGKRWQELANQNPGFQAVCRHFGIKTPDKATARSFVKRLHNHGNTFNTRSIEFVLSKMEGLREIPDCKVKVPKSMDEFLRDFRAIMSCLLRSAVEPVKERLQDTIDSFKPGYTQVGSALYRFRELQARHAFPTFDAFYDHTQGEGGYDLLWVAALYFVGQGERSVTSNHEAKIQIVNAIIQAPELVNNVPRELETAVGAPGELLRSMRTAILEQLNDRRTEFSAGPTLDRTFELYCELDGFVATQIADYMAEQFEPAAEPQDSAA